MLGADYEAQPHPLLFFDCVAWCVASNGETVGLCPQQYYVLFLLVEKQRKSRGFVTVRELLELLAQYRLESGHTEPLNPVRALHNIIHGIRTAIRSIHGCEQIIDGNMNKGYRITARESCSLKLGCATEPLRL